MDLLDGIGIDDSSLPFRIAVLEDSSGRSLGMDFDWPMIAAESLAAGFDTPALVNLASAYVDAESITIRELVLSSAAELGLQRPSPPNAIRALGMIVSQALLNGSITPVPALGVVASLTDYGDLDWELYLMYVPAYDWEELPHSQDEITEQLRSSAHELLGADGRPLSEVIIDLTGRLMRPS